MIPHPWTFALLTLAAFRLYRLVARDTITEPLRAAASYPDASTVTLDRQGVKVVLEGGAPAGEKMPKTLRIYVATLLRCPWCLGTYVTLAVWGAWLLWPHAVTLGAVPVAMMSLIGLVAKIDK